MPKKIAIELSADELNNLLGGDSEAAVVLKSRIVADFSKRYLKVHSEDALNKALRTVNTSIKEEVNKKFGKYVQEGYRKKFELSGEIKEAVEKTADNALHSQLDEQLSITAAHLVEKYGERLESLLFDRLYDQLIKRFNRNLMGRIEQAIFENSEEDKG